MMDDQQLLRRYADRGSEDAFGELVARYVNLVYSAALRRTGGDAHTAQDVAQLVFTDLARKARSLPDNVVLAGWLHGATRYAASQELRANRRRQLREQEAVAMNALQTQNTTDWEQFRPVLDDALDKLNRTDRDALLLRFFEQRSLAEVGRALGWHEDAARKRVSRALEKLRADFLRRGVATTGAALSAAISANAVQVAPAGMAATVGGASLTAGSTSAGTTLSILKLMAMTKLKTAILGAVVVSAAVAPFIVKEHRDAAKLRKDNQKLQQQLVSLAPLQKENEQLSNQVTELQARIQSAPSMAANRRTELLRLRGEVTHLNQENQEQKQQPARIPSVLTNAMAMGLSTANQWKTRRALDRLARMKQMLNLSSNQESAIRRIMTNHIQLSSQLTMAAMLGKLTPEQASAGASQAEQQESEIKALLTPDQLAAYPEFKKEEAMTEARTSATSETQSMAESLHLTQGQQDKVYATLYNLELNGKSDLSSQPVNVPSKPTDIGAVIQAQVDRQKQELEQKREALAGILSQDQLKAYYQDQLGRINHMAEVMKLLLPATNSESPN